MISLLLSRWIHEKIEQCFFLFYKLRLLRKSGEKQNILYSQRGASGGNNNINNYSWVSSHSTNDFLQKYFQS